MSYFFRPPPELRLEERELLNEPELEREDELLLNELDELFVELLYEVDGFDEVLDEVFDELLYEVDGLDELLEELVS